MTYTRRTKTSVAALVAATLFGALISAPTLGQVPTIPSAEVVPANTSPDDPNRGQWFYFELDPGQSATFDAFVRNPADVPQAVTLYLKDLDFSGGGPALKEGEQTDIGTWGRAEQDKVLIPAKSQVAARFSITVPRDAEPGDHIGAVVAESQPQAAGQFQLVLVAATRLYVTVPGEVRRGLEIEAIKPQLNSLIFPSQLTVSAKIRNTGRVRLDMGVTIKGDPAKGPRVLLSQNSEIYIADLRVPFYGGPVSYAVEATDSRSGLVRKVNTTSFVIPWGLLLILAIASLFGFGLKRWWERRASKMAKLQGDIRRLETLIAQRPTGPQPGGASVDDEAQDEEAAILAALKRARRTQSQGSFERLALALHESGSEALDILLEALEKAGPEHKRALAEAAASYGAAALLSHPRMEKLPAAVAADITLWAARDSESGKEPPASEGDDTDSPSDTPRMRKRPTQKPPARTRRKPPAATHRTKPKPRRR